MDSENPSNGFNIYEVDSRIGVMLRMDFVYEIRHVINLFSRSAKNNRVQNENSPFCVGNINSR